MKPRFRVGVVGLTFEAIHYTPEARGESPVLHGHTFRVDVLVEGYLDEHGMVVDFRLLRDTVRSVLSEWDMSIILPRGESFEAHGLFTYRVKRLPFETATVENIAYAIALEVVNAMCRRLGEERCKKLKLVVRVWESVDRYAEVELAPT